jgi:hypothetical protein
MLIKESTLRRIIREEARRALREDDAAVPTPVAAPAPVPAPAKPPLTDPALIDTMIKSRLKASAGRLLNVVDGLKSEYGADEIEGRVEFTFDILTTGLVDRNTIKVKASPQTYQKEIETAFKNEVIRIRFDPIMSPVIGKAHAFSIPPGDV